METNKKTKKFIILWIAIWYILLQAIFFTSLYFYSTGIAMAMPKANGEPSDEIGFILGFIPAFITMLLAKIFIYDKVLKKLEHGCSPK